MEAKQLKAWEDYFSARDRGLAVEAAARRAKISAAAAYRFERGDQSSQGLEAAALLGVNSVAGNLVNAPLSPEAQASLEDFALFRLRYFGRKSTQWQVRAAYELLRAVQSPEREYVVINAPPGSGKSTLFTCDIPTWLLVKDRSIRIQIGSRTERQARMYVSRIKKALERDAPLRADSDSLEAGTAFDAEACIQDDFGAFKPEGRSDLWRADALVARQLDGVSLDDKEPSVSAWGQDSGFLGGRFDVVIWDDLVDKKNTKTADSKVNLREWWGTEAETRLEPRGALILQGQRIAHDDLYRFCLDQKTVNDMPKYRHIVFQAHDDDRCQKIHDDKALPWPDGCLLDPHRLPMKMLDTIRTNSPRIYEVQYQQNEGDAAGGLVDKIWITGGVDKYGYDAPGCLDDQRGYGVVPVNLRDGNGWSFVTVDPSPTEWWGIIWWVYDWTTENRYAVDLIRRKMDPQDFLSMNLDDGTFSGLCEDLRKQAIMQGAPLTHIIVETNAAQRWLLSQPHVQRWMEVTGIIFVPHTTSVNKADPKYGVESIGDLFRQGKIRLPNLDIESRNKSQALVDEAVKYPDHDTTDMVMSTWFGKLGVENFFSKPRFGASYRQSRPEWMGYGRPQSVSRGMSTTSIGV
jgi:hypothetical protein